MSETLSITLGQSKEDRYAQLFPQLKTLISSETDQIANFANLSAALKEVFGWWWVGFYLVKGNELVLGPFQGAIACTRIAYGKGVCGTAWKEEQSVLVPDVSKFIGHIACSSATVSEVVVPVFDAKNRVVAVLDVDSECFGVLDATDVQWLEKIVKLLQ